MRKQPVEERFWKYVNKTIDCWEWTAFINPGGYGRITNTGGEVLAHRVSYQIAFGKIPKGRFVLHRCDNRKCVNPQHLFIGTIKDNCLDAVKKGRHCFPPTRFGEQHSQSKLTESAVRKIKSTAIKRGDITMFARKYGVAVETIRDVVNNKTWKNCH